MSKTENYVISTDFTAQAVESRTCKPMVLQAEINAVLAVGKQAMGIEVNSNTDACIVELEDGYDPGADKAALDAVIAAHTAKGTIRARLAWNAQDILVESSLDGVNWFAAKKWPHTIP